MRRTLAQIRRWLRRETEDPPYPPDLSDGPLLARLSAVLREHDPSRKTAGVCTECSPKARIAAHFADREAPAFFCKPTDVQGLAKRLRSERPAAVAALRARVQADRVQGLRVVGRRDLPLDQGVVWCGIAPGPGADDLYAAQPHRFGFVPRLALAALHGDDTLPLLARVLQSWIEAVKAGEPECYHSPLAVLYRVLACSWTLVLVAGGDAPPRLREDMVFTLLKILAADRDFLEPSIGRSYPNNHLLADGFAAWFLGLMYPEFGGAEGLLAKGEALFVRELMRQFYADGGNFEHSTHYHELGCEMAAAYVLLSRRNGRVVPAEVCERLHAMLAFQAAVGGPEARPLPLGDTTEDPLFPLDAEHGWANGAMRELLRALYEPAIAAAPEADATVERAYWMLAGALAPRQGLTSDEPSRHFDLAGVHVLADAALDARLIFRAGPMSDLPLSAGHAHADVLSLHLNVGGRPVVVNSGTGTYRAAGPRWPAGCPDWRHYFAGPRSHNAVFIGVDPFGPMTGDFRNRDVPCRVRQRRRSFGPGIALFEFEVAAGNAADGLRRCVVHVEGVGWLVEDGWRAGPDGAASFGMQFAPGASVESASAGSTIASLEDVACRIDLEPGWQAPTVLSGSSVPLGGWVAVRYGEWVAAPQLRAVAAAGRASAAAFVQPGRGEAGEVVDWHRDESGVAVRVRRGEQAIVIALSALGSRMHHEPWGLDDVDGAVALWCIGTQRVDYRHT